MTIDASAELFFPLFLAGVAFVVLTVQALLVILYREQVVKDLRERLCEPVSVRWKWTQSRRIGVEFRVIHTDIFGKVHSAVARVDPMQLTITWFPEFPGLVKPSN